MIVISITSIGNCQVKVSDMPTYVGNPNGAWVPIVLNNINRKVDAKYFGFSKTDTLFLHGDSLFFRNGTGIHFFKLPPKVDTIWRNAGVDSFYYKLNGHTYAIKDSTGGSGGSSKFGKAGEDATSAETRQFTSTGHKFNIINADSIRIDTKPKPATGWPSNLILTPGYAQLYGGDTSIIGSVHQTNVNSAGDIAINAGDSITVQGVRRANNLRSKPVRMDTSTGKLLYYDDVAGANTLTNGKFWIGNGSNVPTERNMSGDGTMDNAGAFTLATVNSNVGTFGDATHVSQVTLDAKGRATAASSVAITFPVTGASQGDTSILNIVQWGGSFTSPRTILGKNQDLTIDNLHDLSFWRLNTFVLGSTYNYIFNNAAGVQINSFSTVPSASLSLIRVDSNKIRFKSSTMDYEWDTLKNINTASSWMLVWDSINHQMGKQVIPTAGGSSLTLNSQTGSTQTFATGTSGTDFGISSASNVHTFNIPTASASNRGLLSTTDWSAFNGKQAVLSGTGFVKSASGTITYISAISLTTDVTGTLPVANGGSGAATLTGILKGNGTSAFTAAAAGTDYQAPINVAADHNLAFASNALRTNKIPQVISDASTITVNMNSGFNFIVTGIAGNHTLAFTNIDNGDFYSGILKATGSDRTVTLPGGGTVVVPVSDTLLVFDYYINDAHHWSYKLSSGTGSGSGTVNSGTANQLAYYSSTGTAVSGLTAITANKALKSNSSGLPIAATTTDVELEYVHGVTSAIQTQLDTKQSALTFDKSIVNNSGTVHLVKDSADGDFVIYNKTNLSVYSFDKNTGVRTWKTGARMNTTNLADGDRLRFNSGDTSFINIPYRHVDTTGLTSAATVFSYTNGASDATFNFGGYFVSTTSGSLSYNVTFTDETNTSRTLPFAAISTGYHSVNNFTIRAKASTTITVDISYSSGTPTYDAGVTLQKMY